MDLTTFSADEAGRFAVYARGVVLGRMTEIEDLLETALVQGGCGTRNDLRSLGLTDKIKELRQALRRLGLHDDHAGTIDLLYESRDVRHVMAHGRGGATIDGDTRRPTGELSYFKLNGSMVENYSYQPAAMLDDIEATYQAMGRTMHAIATHTMASAQEAR